MQELAESLSNGEIDEDVAIRVLGEGGSRDLDKAYEFLHLIKNICFPNAIKDDEIKIKLDQKSVV